MSEENATNQNDVPEQENVNEGVGDPGEQHEIELDENGNPVEQTEPEAQDDTEEVEHEGKKYRVPKDLKPALMMHADYTRKTQEVAELRRAAEAERQQYQQASAEHVQALAAVHSLDQQIGQFQKVNWQELGDSDPVQAQKLWIQFSQLKDSRQQLVGQVQQMEQQRAFEAQQENAKRIEEGHAALKREIPNWGPELVGQIRDYAVKELGFQPQELQQVNDPRVVKLIHAAMVGTQLVKKQQQAATTSQPAKPVTKVGGNSPARNDPNSLGVNDWMKARNDQLRKKGR